MQGTYTETLTYCPKIKHCAPAVPISLYAGYMVVSIVPLSHSGIVEAGNDVAGYHNILFRTVPSQFKPSDRLAMSD